METSSSIQQYLHTAPKAELHVHLEGSIQPATLLTLAKRNGVELPVQTIEEMQKWFSYSDFDHFINIYLAITLIVCATAFFHPSKSKLWKQHFKQN
jgi:adenosine deaminase